MGGLDGRPRPPRYACPGRGAAAQRVPHSGCLAGRGAAAQRMPWVLRRQPRAAFGAAAAHDRPAGSGAHPVTEAVATLAAADVRLVRTLHRNALDPSVQAGAGLGLCRSRASAGRAAAGALPCSHRERTGAVHDVMPAARTQTHPTPSGVGRVYDRHYPLSTAQPGAAALWITPCSPPRADPILPQRPAREKHYAAPFPIPAVVRATRSSWSCCALCVRPGGGPPWSSPLVG